MRRYRQTLPALLDSLSAIPASWRDDRADAIIASIEKLPHKGTCAQEDVARILDGDFIAGLATVRLLLDMSKDEFEIALKSALGSGGIGVKRYTKQRGAFLAALDRLGILTAIEDLAARKVTWRDLLVERLKGGRGSAIKGQSRGRYLEDFVEDVVREVFLDVGYDVRCRFVGAAGTSTEKTDIAIPSKDDPQVLIEAKAYGATGSKQTDILGDVGRIVEQKRHDTHFLLVTDGITWTRRTSDLGKLVDMQNRGLIARIYTLKMAKDLAADLRQLRRDHGL